MVDLETFKPTVESYLDAITNTQHPYYDSDLAAEYTALQSDETLSDNEYNERIYRLYMKTYYKELSNYELPSTPTLRDYYTIITDENEQFLLIYDDMCVGSLISNQSTFNFTGY